MSPIKKSVLLTAVLLALAGGAHAQKAGDDIISAGIVSVNPSTSLGALNSVGPAAGAFNPLTVGASASISSVNTLTVGWLHMFTDNIGAELTVGIPPKLTFDLTTPNGTSLSHPGAATATYLAPAVVAKYLFNKPTDQWRPYVGLGTTYISFNDISVNKADTMVNTLGGSSASLSSGWAPIYNLGVIYNIDARWSINAAVSYIPFRTTIAFSGTGGGTGTTTSGNLDLNTTDYVIRVGYKF
jgi:outer membrane protein